MHSRTKHTNIHKPLLHAPIEFWRSRFWMVVAVFFSRIARFINRSFTCHIFNAFLCMRSRLLRQLQSHRFASLCWRADSVRNSTRSMMIMMCVLNTLVQQLLIAARLPHAISVACAEIVLVDWIAGVRQAGTPSTQQRRYWPNDSLSKLRYRLGFGIASLSIARWSVARRSEYKSSDPALCTWNTKFI